MIDHGEFLSADTRRMIEAAAERAGLSVGDWLNAVILDAAAEEDSSAPPPKFKEQRVPVKRVAIDIDAIHVRLDDLAAKIELLAKSQVAEVAPVRAKSPKTAVQRRDTEGFVERLAELVFTPSRNGTAMHMMRSDRQVGRAGSIATSASTAFRNTAGH
jgi:hypothetical protein